MRHNLRGLLDRAEYLYKARGGFADASIKAQIDEYHVVIQLHESKLISAMALSHTCTLSIMDLGQG